VAGLNRLAPTARPPSLAGVPRLWLLQLPAPRDHAAAHRLLREILAHDLACPAEAVPLRHASSGAPEISGHPLGVSLAYADEMLLLGVCHGAQIGVDLLRIQPVPDWHEVATLYLGPQRCAELAACPAARRDAAFARQWAELEARSKCLGLGLQEHSPTHAARLYAGDIQMLPVVCEQPWLTAALAIRR